MIGCGGSDGPADVSPDTPPATDDGSNGDVAHDDAAQDDTTDDVARDDAAQDDTTDDVARDDTADDDGADTAPDSDIETSCEPECGDRVCGPDPVCRLPCGTCTAPEVCTDQGQCCTQDCAGRVCGPDPVCGLPCGTCTAPEECNDQGRCECVKDCKNRDCGLDPVCGLPCGTCTDPEVCTDQGQCCTKNCAGRVCGPDPVCGLSCGPCSASEVCTDQGQCCTQDCTNRNCGPDPVCGQPCGECGDEGVCDHRGVCMPTVVGTCVGDWCLIPAGTFNMGSPIDEPNRSNAEGPVHSVTITQAFYMKQTEVTHTEWDVLFVNNPAYFQTCGRKCPVDSVNWYEAARYANALSGMHGFDKCYTITDCTGTAGVDLDNCKVSLTDRLDCTGYRLPTEAEWEYAARAGSTEPRYGDINEIAWYDLNSSNQPHPVGGKTANAWGLKDMLGNLAEWVNDWFDEDAYTSCSAGCEDPLGPYQGSKKVMRGASWDASAEPLRAAYRVGDAPNVRSGNIGFRLVRQVPQQ
ncbi:MAG TPA: formylglycine-generating enzyme family protein [Myxococcota bacterium]|nr:formylglycine-generating enzyme family protein [Myxococcota bacterium]